MTIHNTKSIEETLGILDLPEEEQYHALTKYKHGDYGKYLDYTTICHLASCRISLADLAFRMRDEAVKKDSSNFGRAKIYVCIKCANDILYDCWWDLYSQPIHWILAAIISGIFSQKRGTK